MRYFVRSEIERFLRAVDVALERSATVVIIGGGAAALKYRIDDPTTDIDTFSAIGADLERAISAARKATGLAMPFEQSGVADGPYGFEDRLLRAMPRLARLKVLVPERHDLALMKTVRGNVLALVESLFPDAGPLVEKALRRPDQRTPLDAFLASQAALGKRRRSPRSPRR